jgi:DNA-binding MarR family transcriptional regulator
MTKLYLDTYLPYRLSVTSNKVSALIARAYENRFGLSVPQWRLLAVLAETSHLSQQELVLRTAMDKVTVSRAAAALMERGLIARKTSQADRRAAELSLTPAGISIVDEVVPLAQDFEKALIEAIGVADAGKLEAMLRKIEAQAEKLGH